jgi:hypothetical protein
MEKISQKQIILNYLQDINEWLPSYKLVMVNTKYGWLGSQAKRRVQELFVEGKVERKMEGKYVYYKAKELQYTTFKVLNPDGSVEKEIKLIGDKKGLT